ncbi:MAG: hypothetical protein CFE24_11500 [Flavobacterium sp. BFFFF2]|nr:MAG: hypothetical protein CFE24_11500 [Flavobacterium sp. BFFFF2]
MNLRTLSLLLLLGTSGVYAQDDLLNELDSGKKTKEVELTTFKGIQICTMQSTKLAAKGEWYFMVSHRFGDLTEGTENFFGLDNALTKIAGYWGPTSWLMVGAARTTYNKVYEGTLKVKLFNQETNGFPFTIVSFNSIEVNSKLKKAENPEMIFSDRLAYSFQLPISRKVNNEFSLEVNPIFIHKNLYDPAFERKDQFLLAAGGRYKLTKRISANLEYALRFAGPENETYHNPLTIGMDLDTGGHIFQLVVSNSQPMNDVGYFTNGAGSWNKGALYFGFNMYRVF